VRSPLHLGSFSRLSKIAVAILSSCTYILNSRLYRHRSHGTVITVTAL
jgi:hypothetical protein